MRWTLVLTTHPDCGVPWRGYVLHPDQRVILGCTRAADLVIQSDSMSRRHAAIWCEDGRWMIEDMASTGGTYLDEVLVVSPAPVPFGSMLRLGAVRFNVTSGMPDAQPSVALRPVPLPDTYRVLLRDGAVWTVAREDYEAFMEYVSGDPFWPSDVRGEVDLRRATRAELTALLDAADLECGRTQLRPSTFHASMHALARLLRPDWRLRNPPPTEAEIRNEHARAGYARAHVRAEARLHRGDPSFRPTPADQVSLPRDLDMASGTSFCFAVEKLDATNGPTQEAVDRVAALLSGTIDAHVVSALHGERSDEWGTTYAAAGNTAVPVVARAFLARYRPSTPAMQRLHLAILVMSEALKAGIHFYANVDDYEERNVTVWFHHFHDMADEMSGA